MGDDDVYLNTLNRMESDIAVVDRDGAMASIAISLKRIADALDNPNNLLYMANVIEGAIYRGLSKNG